MKSKQLCYFITGLLVPKEALFWGAPDQLRLLVEIVGTLQPIFYSIFLYSITGRNKLSLLFLTDARYDYGTILSQMGRMNSQFDRMNFFDPFYKL